MRVRIFGSLAAVTLAVASPSLVGGVASAASPHVATSACTVDNLTITRGVANGTAGTIYYSLRFFNKSSKTCTLHAIPRVQPVLGAAHTPIGPKATSVMLANRSVAVTIVAHHGVANAQFGVVDAGNFTPLTCVQKNANGVVVTVGTTSYYLKFPVIAVCTKRASTSITGFAPGP